MSKDTNILTPAEQRQLLALALEIAIFPPEKFKDYAIITNVDKQHIIALRTWLDGKELDWRGVKRRVAEACAKAGAL